jgi:hypothetical protein
MMRRKCCLPTKTALSSVLRCADSSLALRMTVSAAFAIIFCFSVPFHLCEKEPKAPEGVALRTHTRQLNFL